MKALDLWYITLMKHHQIHLLVEANSYIYLCGMRLHHPLQHHQHTQQETTRSGKFIYGTGTNTEGSNKTYIIIFISISTYMPWKTTHQTKTTAYHMDSNFSPEQTTSCCMGSNFSPEQHDDDLATTSSSSVHSGTQAFELLIEDDDLYFNMKQPATTNFPENNETQPTAQHIYNCSMGGNTSEDVTMEIHQPPTQLKPSPQNVESVTMKKKEVNVPNINHEDEFKECMESFNIQNGADSFYIIMNAISL